jgi:hypothetical protein
LDCCSAQLSMNSSSANVAEDGGGQVRMFHVHLVHTKPLIMYVLCSNQYTFIYSDNNGGSSPLTNVGLYIIIRKLLVLFLSCFNFSYTGGEFKHVMT